MVIIALTTHGMKLGKHKEMFKITFPNPEKAEELIPAEQVEEILVEASISLSSSAIRLASKYSIPILFLSSYEPLAILSSFTAHGTVQIRREQILAYNDRRGVTFVSAILKSASFNKRYLLQDLLRRRKSFEDKDKVNNIITTIDTLIRKFSNDFENIDECRNHFFAIEAEITKQYFEGLKIFLDKKDPKIFDGRSRRPPKDPFNALLSYGYAVLTAQIHKATIIAGLEPFAGFLHTDRSGKVSFVLDLIEVFRQPIVDRLALTLFNKNIVKLEDFEYNQNGVLIEEHAKKLILDNLFGILRENTVKYKNKTTSFLKIFVDQARSAGKFFVRGDNFTPYRMR
ncbi:MAG: CRISPR-associated endonuclease Cas1 [Candidatus Heimdallarchaeaceae archaeon]